MEKNLTLPELNVISLRLNSKFKNSKLTDLSVSKSFISKLTEQELRKKLKDLMLVKIFRQGRFLVFEFREENFLVFAPSSSMSFELKNQLNSDTKVKFDFKNYSVSVRDTGERSTVEYARYSPSKTDYLVGAGLDISFIDSAGFLKIHRAHEERSIAEVLLDQEIICGLWKNDVIEILFLAKIHPSIKIKDLADDQINHIYLTIFEYLRTSIKSFEKELPEFCFSRLHTWFKIIGDDVCRECGREFKRIFEFDTELVFCPLCQKI